MTFQDESRNQGTDGSDARAAWSLLCWCWCCTIGENKGFISFDISPAKINTTGIVKAMFPNLREQHYVFMSVFLKPQHFQCSGKFIHWRSWMVVRWRGEAWGLGQGATTAGDCCAGRRLRVTTISWWQDSRSIQSSPGERRGGPCEQTQ